MIINGHEHKYSLQEWLLSHVERTIRDDGNIVAIYYGIDIRGDKAWELWHLTDYVVSSVSGGTIWLVKR